MEHKKTLKELFESRKNELSEKLSTLSLPKDASKIQSVVTDYLNELFDSDGEFRQNLTQSEDYILQAAMSLLNAQQSMVGEFTLPKFADGKKNSEDKQQPETIPVPDFGGSLKNEQYPYVVGGTTVGGAAGALIFGTWGAVFGAIAGTALVLYYSSQLPQNSNKNKKIPPQTRIEAKPVVKEQKINVDVFTNIVGSICDSVDTLIQTFRAQINRVVDKYESIEKPSLEQEYRFLIEGIQTLVGYKRTHADDDKYTSKLQMRIEDLAETLENYNLTVEDYTEENKSWFEAVESSKVDTPKMVYPAIVKNGSIILQGKVFIPQK
jgi:hypothetical protein